MPVLAEPNTRETAATVASRGVPVSGTPPEEMERRRKLFNRTGDFRAMLPREVRRREDRDGADRETSEAIAHAERIAVAHAGLAEGFTFDTEGRDTETRRKAFDLTQRFLSHVPAQRPYPKRKGIGLYGPTMGGKTTLLKLTAAAAKQAAPWLKIETFGWSDFCEQVQETARTRDSISTDLLKRIRGLDVVFIDEIQLLLNHSLDAVRATIKAILWEYYEHRRPTLMLTAQDSPEALNTEDAEDPGAPLIGDETMNRLLAACLWVELDGDGRDPQELEVPYWAQ